MTVGRWRTYFLKFVDSVKRDRWFKMISDMLNMYQTQKDILFNE